MLTNREWTLEQYRKNNLEPKDWQKKKPNPNKCKKVYRLWDKYYETYVGSNRREDGVWVSVDGPRTLAQKILRDHNTGHCGGTRQYTLAFNPTVISDYEPTHTIEERFEIHIFKLETKKKVVYNSDTKKYEEINND